MGYVLLGGVGFLIGYCLELPRVQGAHRAKPLLGAVGYGLIALSAGLVAFRGERFWLPGWASALGAAVLPLALLLLVYSLFLELPFRRTYIRADHGRYLVTTGTYALVRHPSVLWYGFLLLSMVLVYRSLLLLLALPFWLALDIVWALLQEKLLAEQFPQYQAYRRNTPMLVPNWHSVGACLATMRMPRGLRAEQGGGD